MNNPRDEAIAVLVRKYQSHPWVQKAILEIQKNSSNLGGKDTLGDYLKGAGSYDLLSREQEIELFSKIEDGYQMYSELGGINSDINPEQEKLLIELVAAHQVIYLSNLRLAFSVAKRYASFTSAGLEVMDHVEEAQLGLLQAINRFNINEGMKFSTYGVWWIRQGVSRALANKSRTIRLPVHKNNQYIKVRQMVNEFQSDAGRDIEPEEIEQITGMGYAKYKELMRVGAPDLPSLDEALPHTWDFTLHHIIGKDYINDGIDAFSDHEELVRVLGDIKLEPREKMIIGLRFGVAPEIFDNPSIEVMGRTISYNSMYQAMTDSNGLTLQELSDGLGVTRERVRQLEKKTLEKIRASIQRKQLASVRSA